jgi:signal transduction histidine kinase
VKIKAIEEQGVIIYEIADDGCGMDEAAQQKLFSSIYTTKGLQGSGIGLMTTNKLVRDHGGKIFIHSIPDKGTTFRIVLSRLHLPRTTGS